MGCDISILSKHNLDISNVETLAHDLADRLNLNIDYGYYANEKYNTLLGNNIEDELIKLGSVLKNNSKDRYLLVDENYQAKQLYQKFGDQLFDMKEYWNWTDSIPTEEEKSREKEDSLISDYFLDGIETSGASGYLRIYDELIANYLFSYTRWWDFCRTIQDVNNENYLYESYFQNFRKSVMKSTIALGGEIAYFVNDQCIHLKGVGQGEETYYSWENLEKFINSRENLDMISISKACIDLEYKKEIEEKEMKNFAFYDDFFGVVE